MVWFPAGTIAYSSHHTKPRYCELKLVPGHQNGYDRLKPRDLAQGPNFRYGAPGDPQQENRIKTRIANFLVNEGV